MSTPASGRLPVVLLWHMHQPHYRDARTGDYELPWTYLHGLKDYSDMAAHLEANPQARAVINVTPVLIEQLSDYVRMLRAHLQHGERLRDPVLALLADDGLPATSEGRAWAVGACLRAQRQRMIGRFPAYEELARELEPRAQSSAVAAVDEQALRDLAVWYHLGWCGESLRRTHPLLERLAQRARGFDAVDRRELLELLAGTLAGILPRWRALAEAGQVELSVTPYSHPILPLLQDFGTAREALPASGLPQAHGYPGGAERAAWHVREGLRRFAAEFGFSPTGCWPAEGAISRATLELLDTHGFDWIASGGQPLEHSLRATHEELGPAARHQPYRLRGARLQCFFRDDALSDLIGFEYARWHGDDAAADVDARLTRLAREYGPQAGRCVLIALDGENAWEHYPDNGWWFLSALYRQLAANPHLELTTLAEVCRRGATPVPLARVVAGSWVHGTLSTWMGDADKNRAWDWLCAAKRAFDAAVAAGRLGGEALRAAERQLALCESSDWFWWFGDYNPAEAVASFDRLYRRQLTALYNMLGEPAPPELALPLSRGGGAAEGGGTMRRAQV